MLNPKFRSVAEKEFFGLVVGGLRKVYIGHDPLVVYHKELNKSLLEILPLPGWGGESFFFSVNDKIRLLEDHRKDAFIVCPRECWCWELEKEILEEEIN